MTKNLCMIVAMICSITTTHPVIATEHPKLDHLCPKASEVLDFIMSHASQGTPDYSQLTIPSEHGTLPWSFRNTRAITGVESRIANIIFRRGGLDGDTMYCTYQVNISDSQVKRPLLLLTRPYYKESV